MVIFQMSWRLDSGNKCGQCILFTTKATFFRITKDGLQHTISCTKINLRDAHKTVSFRYIFYNYQRWTAADAGQNVGNLTAKLTTLRGLFKFILGSPPSCFGVSNLISCHCSTNVTGEQHLLLHNIRIYMCIPFSLNTNQRELICLICTLMFS